MESVSLIAICGPTASGKTTAAIEIAKRYNGEIICVDSRTMYKDLNIGTAKPLADEQAGIHHWGLDIVKPGERFTVADFKEYTDKKISEIRTRSRLPILVGGTGLYMSAVLYGYEFNSKMSNETMVIPGAKMIGITPVSKMQHREIIAARAEHMFSHGVVQEAKELGKKYGWENVAMTANIYRLIRDFLDGKTSADELKSKFIVSDIQLAKRQMTWFRRDSNILWVQNDEVSDTVKRILSEH